MKTIYTIALALLNGAMCAQFFTAVTYKGAFPVTDGATGIASNDWTAGWTNWDPENTNYPATTVTVSSDITSSTTWATGSTILLQNKVYVKNGATLTIQPGVIIRGDYATQGTLLISRGSKINAQGTQTSPIVFTSNNGVGNRAEGDWGGVVICGSAVINQPGGIANIEGVTASIDNEFGGSSNQDSSGVFSYVRIEFAGIPLQPNKEINGLTMGAVGSRTQIDHVQVSFCGDDGYEWFGGTVSAKYLISFRNLDDDFDTDFGYQGNIQFALIVRDADLSDAAGDSNGFESDNEGASPFSSLPLTQPVFSNITCIGPKRDGSLTLPVGEKFERGIYIRRNSGTSVFNSLIIGWEKGFHVKDAGTLDNFTTNDTAVFAHNVVSADNPVKYVIDPISGSTSAFYGTIHTSDMNDTLTNTNAIAFINGFPPALNATPDYRLQNVSTVSTGADFTHPKLSGQVGVNSLTHDNMLITVYPNPADDFIRALIKLETQENIAISVLDLNGKALFNVPPQKNIPAGSIAVPIRTSTLPNGVYLLRIQGLNFMQTEKILVHH